jgi:hypothetical protein
VQIPACRLNLVIPPGVPIEDVDSVGEGRDWRKRAGISIRVPPFTCGRRRRAELDVGERREISNVLCRLRGCVTRSSLSVAKQLEWDDTGAHA